MSLSKIATRYAKSLIDLAQERKELDQVHEDVLMFQEVAKNKDFKLLLNSPIVSIDKKRKVFKALFDGKTTELTSKFLDIVLDKGREDALPAIMRAFNVQYKSIKHISDLKITSATELSAATVKSIKDKLVAENAIYEDVEVVTEVDPNLLGGMVLEFGGQLYDASISRKLRTLKKDFVGNLYISQIERK
ncbi:MAG: ATP synthase F1 subunit delta [Bacteroidota bacterium]